MFYNTVYDSITLYDKLYNSIIYYRQALFIVSVLMAKPVFVVSVLTAKPVFVVGVGLKVFQKSKVYQFFVNLENEII